MKNRLFADFHILQTVPPSCLNRDDTGSPKTAVYGGVTRARVSSQSWKKAVRDEFRAVLSGTDVGVRTKRIQDMISNELKSLGYSENADEAAKKVLILSGLQEKTLGAGKDAPLFFMSHSQAKGLAKLIIDGQDKDKKRVLETLNADPSIDLALFGRMVADNANLNIDASCQVAHAISTHKVINEFDYFTAVDDFPPEDKIDAGAAMIGTVEYNSSTLYRFATIAVHELSRQLGSAELAAWAVKVFADAFAHSMPTGKINTFANRTIPDTMLLVLRPDQPINLVGAFERPVRAERGESGYIEPSATALALKANEAAKWVDSPLLSLAINNLMRDVNGVQIAESFDDMLSRIESEVGAALS